MDILYCYENHIKNIYCEEKERIKWICLTEGVWYARDKIFRKINNKIRNKNKTAHKMCSCMMTLHFINTCDNRSEFGSLNPNNARILRENDKEEKTNAVVLKRNRFHLRYVINWRASYEMGTIALKIWRQLKKLLCKVPRWYGEHIEEKKPEPENTYQRQITVAITICSQFQIKVFKYFILILY